MIEYQSSERPGLLQVWSRRRPESRPRDCAARALRSAPGRPRRRDGAVVQHARGIGAELRHRTWFPAHAHDADLRRRPAHDRAGECSAWRRAALLAELDPRKVFELDSGAMLDIPGEVSMDDLSFEQWLEDYWRHPDMDLEASVAAVVDNRPVASRTFALPRAAAPSPT